MLQVKDANKDREIELLKQNLQFKDKEIEFVKQRDMINERRIVELEEKLNATLNTKTSKTIVQSTNSIEKVAKDIESIKDALHYLRQGNQMTDKQKYEYC
jgi:hypothetical protein